MVGWITFLVAAVTYLLTIEPTTSLWDCGEFIASAFKLEVGHPPGAPFFMLLARFFSLFASGPEHVAKMINTMSGLASAATILFLFWTITHFARKILIKDGDFTKGKVYAVLGAGLVGALAYAFSDTFWFSAVEAEVYALSSFFTAIVFWAALKWEESADQPYANRWLIFIAYLMGLSIGVHLLNLLAIPAIVFIYYFKKYDVSKQALSGFGLLALILILFVFLFVVPVLLKVLIFAGIVYLFWHFSKNKLHKAKGFAGLVVSVLASVVILGAIMYVLIPGVVKFASVFELIFVNGFNLPYNTGVLFYVLLVISLLVWGLMYTRKKGKVIANTIVLALTMIVIGYSSFAAIVIRSYANPPMDENNPEDVYSLLNYLNREQYGDRPLVFGQYYNAQAISSKERTTRIQKDGEYVESYLGTSYDFDSKFETLFPRMYSGKADHVEQYKKFGRIEGTPIKVQTQQGTETRYKPTFSENMRFFLSYQVGHMYFRYFMWNFAGRQNDTQSNGGIVNGNWISGIPVIDKLLVGPQDNLPDYLKDNTGRNVYYFLPLLLGLAGFFFHSKKHGEDFTVMVWLFFMTGLAIVIYLNQYPNQPRERDYAYAASFYAFAIWIGLGVVQLYEILTKNAKLKPVLSAVLVTVLCTALVPGIMAAENWDDHDRSGRYTARDYAYNYLNSCTDNAILFTNGDNDTFPLWYAQEVEGVRTDVRVCNLSLLGTDWYIDQMKKQAYESDPVPFKMTHDKYVQGTRDVVYVFDKINEHRSLSEMMDFVASDDPRTKLRGNGEEIDYIPGKRFYLPVNKENAVKYGIVKPEDAAQMEDTIFFTMNKTAVAKNELLLLDLLGNYNWDRPIYFVSVGGDGDLGFRNYLQYDGFAYRLVPIRSKGGDFLNTGRIDTDVLYTNLMEKFKWGGINNEDVLVDYYNLRTLSVLHIRNTFARLANELVAENKSEKAIAALDRVVSLLPKDKVPYDIFSVDVVEAYYNAGEIEKGNALSQDIFNDFASRMEYYLEVSKYKGQVMMEYDMQLVLHIMRNLSEFAASNGQKELAKKYEDAFTNYYMNFAGMMQGR